MNMIAVSEANYLKEKL